MEPDKKLTDNSQTLTPSHFYMGFSYAHPEDDWMGLCEFKNTDQGHKLHRRVYDFMEYYNFEMRALEHSQYKQLVDLYAHESVLSYNFKGWPIHDSESAEFLIDLIILICTENVRQTD